MLYVCVGSVLVLVVYAKQFSCQTQLRLIYVLGYVQVDVRLDNIKKILQRHFSPKIASHQPCNKELICQVSGHIISKQAGAGLGQAQTSCGFFSVFE